jgi:Tfp pilus assembly protein PilO
VCVCVCVRVCVIFMRSLVAQMERLKAQAEEREQAIKQEYQEKIARLADELKESHAALHLQKARIEQLEKQQEGLLFAV